MLRLPSCLMAVALVAAFLLPLPVRSDIACPGIESEVAAKKQTYPGSTVFLRLFGPEAKAFMVIFNTAPPVTHYQADVVVGLYRVGPFHEIDPNFLFLFFNNGCYFGMSAMTPEQFREDFPNFKPPPPPGMPI